MTRPVLRAAGATAYAALVVGAVVAPAVVFDTATARGGAERPAGLDLVIVSAAVGVPYAAYLHGRLRRPVTQPGARLDLCLSAVHGLVVLSLASSALPAAALHATARLHARVVDAEWPVLVSWSALLGVAVLLSEAARRRSLRWLSGGRAART